MIDYVHKVKSHVLTKINKLNLDSNTETLFETEASELMT